MHSLKYIVATVVAVAVAFVAVATMRITTTPCEFEDSTNCHWIASDHGNGMGESFIDIMGMTIYLP